MKKIALLFSVFLTLQLAMAEDIFVSTSGNDANTGTEASPFATLQRALDYVDGNASGKTIWMNGGTYRIDNSVTLGKSHSGTSDNPLVIRSVKGETVNLAGGKPLSGDGFTLVTDDATLSRMPLEARGKVMVIDINESLEGFFKTKDLYNETASIVWNGYVLQNAKFPNKGYAYISEVIDAGPQISGLGVGESPAYYSEANPTGGTFKLRETIDWDMLAAEFQVNKDILVDGYLSNDWYFDQERVGDVDASKEEIKLLRYTRYGVGSNISLSRRLVIKNAFCQLDQAGEWYYDRPEKKFYIWPVQKPNNQQAITLLETTRLIDGNDCSNVTIRDINFQSFGVEGVRFQTGNSILIAGCGFHGSTGMGCRLAGVTNSGVQSCDFAYVSQAFVVKGDDENRKTLTRENNFGRNNHIHHCTKKGYGLVSVSGMGSEFSNNLMHSQNGAYAYSGNDMTVQYNEFYDVGYEMGDWNTIYNNADFSELGNRIRRNFFHHMLESPGGHPIAPARTDDLGAGFHFQDNIMYKTGSSCVMFQGPDNSITGNVSMEVNYLFYTMQAPYEDVPKSEWATQTAYLQQQKDEYDQLQADIDAGTVDFNIKENKIGKGELIFGENGWETNQLWIDHYPNFANLFSFLDINNNPWMPCHNVIKNNYMSGQKSFAFDFHGPSTNLTNYETVKEFLPTSCIFEDVVSFDPTDMFVDAEMFDFNFKDSFTPMPGFEKWDFDSVGLYIDEYRTSIPDKTSYRMSVKEKYNGESSSGSRVSLDELNDRYDYPAYLSLVSNLAVISEPPVLYWPIEGGAALNVYDMITDADAIWQNSSDQEIPSVVGLVGNAISTDGLVDNYLLASSDTLVSATAASMSAWINISSLESGNVVVNGEASSLWGISLIDGKPTALCNGTSYSSSAALSLDEWHLLTYVWSDAGTLELYVDAESVVSQNAVATSFSNNATWTLAQVKSILDEVAVMRFALTPEEVAFVYMNGKLNKGIDIISPIAVTALKVGPSDYIMRVGNSAIMSVEVFPGDATVQTLIWSSSNEAIVNINNNGVARAISEGDAILTATAVDGGVQGSVSMSVKNDMRGVLPEPVAYWTFDEQDGNVAVDVINDVKATWQGTEGQEWSAGLFRRSATFNAGDEDRFVTESDPLLEATAITVSVWVNLNATGQYEGIVTSRPSVWGISAAENRLDVRTDGAPGYVPGVINAGVWYHLAFTWDNNGNRASYVNGEVVDVQTGATTTYTSNDVWYFGDDICCNGREINGRIDDVMMYREALSADDIKLAYIMGQQGISYQDLLSVTPESVSIDQESFDVKLGETDTLTATVFPDDATVKTVKWSSMNEAILKVDMYGVLETVAVGTTKIVVETEEAWKTDTIEVTVIDNPVKQVEMSVDSISMLENKIEFITANIYPITAPYQEVTWESTNSDVVTVDEFGTIKSLIPGKSLIIITSEDSGVKDTCYVTVQAVLVESISFDVHDMDVKTGDEIFISAVVLPVNANNKKIIWLSSDESVVSVYGDGYFDAYETGTVVLKGITEDGDFSDSCIVRVNGGASPLNDRIADKGIQIYPNPAKESITLSFDNLQQVRSVEIYDAMGVVVKNLFEIAESQEIATDDLPSGYYFVKIQIADDLISSPLLILE